MLHIAPRISIVYDVLTDEEIEVIREKVEPVVSIVFDKTSQFPGSILRSWTLDLTTKFFLILRTEWMNE